jgi:hypothetical protein
MRVQGAGEDWMNAVRFSDSLALADSLCPRKFSTLRIRPSFSH